MEEWFKTLSTRELTVWIRRMDSPFSSFFNTEEDKANIKLAPVGGSNDMTPPSAGGNDIPNFDPTFKRSKEKIKVLGISV